MPTEVSGKTPIDINRLWIKPLISLHSVYSWMQITKSKTYCIWKNSHLWEAEFGPSARWSAGSTLLCKAGTIAVLSLSKCQYILVAFWAFPRKVHTGNWDGVRVMSSTVLRYGHSGKVLRRSQEHWQTYPLFFCGYLCHWRRLFFKPTNGS